MHETLTLGYKVHIKKYKWKQLVGMLLQSGGPTMQWRDGSHHYIQSNWKQHSVKRVNDSIEVAVTHSPNRNLNKFQCEILYCTHIQKFKKSWGSIDIWSDQWPIKYLKIMAFFLISYSSGSKQAMCIYQATFFVL